MAATFTWSITELFCKPQTAEGADYVVTANWRCSGVDGNYNGQINGLAAFPVVQSENFIPYDQLTQQIVLDWCWNAGGVEKNATEARVQDQIDRQINPPVITPPLPWG